MVKVYVDFWIGVRLGPFINYDVKVFIASLGIWSPSIQKNVTQFPHDFLHAVTEWGHVTPQFPYQTTYP